MTLRPIEPIDVTGLTPRSPATEAPICEDVDPRALLVDPAYQRSLSERSMRQIRKIVEHFDWTKFKPPICAFAEDAQGSSVLKVIDGQHTAIAAASNPNIATIPVMIVMAPDTVSQAKAFIGHNTDRLNVTPTQLHHAALAAGSKEALAIDRLCQEIGVRILRNPPSRGIGYEPGDTLSVAGLAALLKRDGAGHARNVLALLRQAQFAPIKGDHLKAADHLLSDPEFGSVELEALPAHIQALGAEADKEAKRFAATHSVPLWKAFANVWFKEAKKRKPRLPVLPPRAAVPAGAGAPMLETLLDELPADRRPAKPGWTVGDWAPGNHLRRCGKCDHSFRGDRLAIECAPCAYGDADG